MYNAVIVYTQLATKKHQGQDEQTHEVECIKLLLCVIKWLPAMHSAEMNKTEKLLCWLFISFSFNLQEKLTI